MGDDAQSSGLAEERRRMERRMWWSPVASLVLPVGTLVAIQLRDAKVINENGLGWAVAGLTLLAVLVVGGIGFPAHERIARLNRGHVTRKVPGQDAQK